MSKKANITAEKWDEVKAATGSAKEVAAATGVSASTVYNIKGGVKPRPAPRDARGATPTAKPGRKPRKSPEPFTDEQVEARVSVTIPARTYVTMRALAKAMLIRLGREATFTGKELEEADRLTLEQGYDGDDDAWRDGTWHLTLKRAKPPAEPTVVAVEPERKPKPATDASRRKAKTAKAKPKTRKTPKPKAPIPFEPDYRVAPGETLKDIMAEQKLSESRVAWKTGLRLGTVRAILDGSGRIDAKAAAGLAALGVSAAFWLGAEEQYRKPVKAKEGRE